jgi:DNA-binding NarL/FixJ family response regulator
MTALRVVLAEDQPMVRAGFRALLDATSEIEVVGEAATGSEALQQARALRPDVVVMDIRMPEMDGLEATRHITTAGELSGTRVLVLTTFELDEYVFGALDAGAIGFLLKGGEPADLVHAIRTVASGEALLAPTVTRRLIDAYVSRPQPAAKTHHDELDELATREREVLGLVATRADKWRDRGRASPQPAHREDTRLADPDEARRSRPSTARGNRLPHRNSRAITEPPSVARDTSCTPSSAFSRTRASPRISSKTSFARTAGQPAPSDLNGP